jgi:CubicO group peptidase (beta-lactamase class C family)
MATTEQRPNTTIKIAASDLPAGLTQARVQAHEISPQHVQGFTIEEVDPAKEQRIALKLPTHVFDTIPKANLEAFGLAIHTALKDSVVGYVLQVHKNGSLAHTGIWNWAQTPADAGQGWNENRRQHIASVSKFLTAVGMVKALDSKGVSYDAKIAGHLPAYWAKGPNVDDITFRDLFTHRSGFGGSSSDSSYAFMKGKVAAGVAANPGYDYENMNFGLCRLLIPIVTGMISKSADFAISKDQIWDALTIQHYKNYMQQHVFTPAGVSNAGFAPAAGGALAYPQPHNGKKGMNSGDLATMAGGAGWRLSVKELLSVMSHFRRKDTIVTKAKAQTILDSGFGIDQILDTPAGKTYNKNGAWGNASGREQAVAYFLPAGMEAVLFVNSRIGPGDGASLRGLVQDAYVGCLTA